ncbi:Pirin [Croceitalea dokdonensis DOKDO 023]|uniref:Pirin n=2 Tax=Croceitalea TaxID=574891 RepID=A0A0P7ATK9_9FLAO|nr:Pirin [Croceitalea dokdonensis DOKDO 023]
MKRKDFLKTTIAGGIATVVGGSAFAKAEKEKSNNSLTNTNVGYNHLPNKETKTMNTILHKADTRGDANHGWLHSKHTFSFANYHNPERMNFGVLRVLNDDTVSESKGFGTHPHRDMEIISIPLEGDLKHEDNMGNKAIIKSGDVQVMSAGTGIMHSEYNNSPDEPVKFLQIWVIPNKQNVTPRYDQITLDTADRKNKLQQVLSPNADDAGVWIHQNAWFNMTNLDKDKAVSYNLNDSKNNGVYAFILKGDATINGQELNQRDGLGIWDVETLDIKADSDTEILLMEVPMAM